MTNIFLQGSSSNYIELWIQALFTCIKVWIFPPPSPPSPPPKKESPPLPRSSLYSFELFSSSSKREKMIFQILFLLYSINGQFPGAKRNQMRELTRHLKEGTWSSDLYVLGCPRVLFWDFFWVNRFLQIWS